MVSYSTLILRGLPHPFSSFSEWNCLTFLCVNVTQMACVSTLSLCECHTSASFLKWKLHLSFLFSQFWQYNEFIYNNFFYFECNNTFTIAWSYSFGFCDSSTRTILVLVLYEIRFSMFHSFSLLQARCLVSWLLLNGQGKFSKFIKILNDLKP